MTLPAQIDEETIHMHKHMHEGAIYQARKI